LKSSALAAADWSSTSVALFTGAWIEILFGIDYEKITFVALFTGAWIEIPPR